MTKRRFLDLGLTFVSPVPVPRDGTTALLTVDMQETVASPDQGFSLAMERLEPGVGDYHHKRVAELVIPTIQALLTYFRAHGLPVVYLIVGSEHRDYRDLPAPFRESHRALEAQSGVSDVLWFGSPASAIRREIAPRPGETVIPKRSFGAFNGSDIDRILRAMGVESLVIVGLGTSVCVESTARDAADRGYRCVLVDEGMADYDEQAHNATLRAFHANFGRVVRGATDVVEAMEAAEPI